MRLGRGKAGAPSWALAFGRRAACSGRAAAARIAALAPYQVALWPDGWLPLPDGALLVRDTDAMAEARRWYALADRNRAGVPVMERSMQVHGTFVPRPLLALSGRRFASAESASVAVMLVAGEWVRQRRDRLTAEAAAALRERELCWSGSRSSHPLDDRSLADRLRNLLDQCAAEGLIPAVPCRIRVRREDGFGVLGFRCTLEATLDPGTGAQVAEALAAALVPWNRVVVRDGRVWPVIAVRFRGTVTG